MRRHQLFLTLALVFAGWLSGSVRAADGPYLAMGFRVGEVTSDSAIVWTRLTAEPTRNQKGYRDPRKREPRQAEFVPPPVPVSAREGAVPAAAGQVRVVYRPAASGDAAVPEAATEWVSVSPEDDSVHQFRLNGLRPATKYLLRVEARPGPDADVSATTTGSFHTAARPDQWQEVTFTVVTGQSYWDLDHPEGFHIYPAMRKLDPQFVVLTGDTVYLDSESPRARTVELARYHWHRMYSLPRHVAFHREVPGYWEVDDHDSWCDDCWPTKKTPWMSPLTFEQGFAVYREQVPIGETTYRTFRWGKGLQIWLVEGRLYRSPNTMPDGPEKSIWGVRQREWLKRSILASDADFRVLISPTPIVGPDRSNKADNHANRAFAWEGRHFREWTKQQGLKNFFVCCGDRHWQYLSIDPATGLHEFSCGPASDKHAGGSPGRNPEIQPFHRVKGGFLSVTVTRKAGDQSGVATILFRHHDVHGKVVHEFRKAAQGRTE